MLTVVTWLWKGWAPKYSALHVNRVARLMQRHLSIPHRTVCITDRPDGVECEVYPLWAQEVPDRVLTPNCYRRLRLFDPDFMPEIGDWILSIDLDVCVFDDITPLITDDPFKAAEGQWSHLNGSMWLLRRGYRRDVWDDFCPVRTPAYLDTVRVPRRPGGPPARRISGSDQAWMSVKMPDAPIWGPSDGVHQYMHLPDQTRVPSNTRLLFFAGGTKAWDAKCLNTAARENWKQTA